MAFAPLLPFVLAFLALTFGAVGDVRKMLDSLPSLVAAGLVVGVIALLGAALRWSTNTVRQARHIEAADTRKKSSSSPQCTSRLQAWGIALAPSVVGLLLLLVGAIKAGYDAPLDVHSAADCYADVRRRHLCISLDSEMGLEK